MEIIRGRIKDNLKTARSMAMVFTRENVGYPSKGTSQTGNKLKANWFGDQITSTRMQGLQSQTSSKGRESCVDKTALTKAHSKTGRRVDSLPTYGKTATGTRGCSRTAGRTVMGSCTTARESQFTVGHGRTTKQLVRESCSNQIKTRHLGTWPLSPLDSMFVWFL